MNALVTGGAPAIQRTWIVPRHGPLTPAPGGDSWFVTRYADAMSVRERAAWALGRIGPGAAPALESLKMAAAADNPRLARLAQQAIARITG